MTNRSSRTRWTSTLLLFALAAGAVLTDRAAAREAPEGKRPSTRPTTRPPRPGDVGSPYARRNVPDDELDHRLIFLCDARKTLPVVLEQLDGALGNLKPRQSFNVIFAAGAKAVVFSPTKLVPATPENVKAAQAFLKAVKPHLASDPRPAVELALSQKPLMVYFFTDHNFTDPKGLHERVDDLDWDTRTRFNTIVVNPPGTVGVVGRTWDLMQYLAHDSDGQFRVVRLDDLEPAPATRPAATKPAGPAPAAPSTRLAPAPGRR